MSKQLAHQIERPVAELSESSYKRAVRWVYIVAIFMQVVDGTIVNIAIPTLVEEFAADESAVSWTVTSYLLAVAVFVPSAGWLGDRFGMKQMFVGGLALFTLASVACGLAQTLGQLVAFRAAQGAATGVLGPLGSAVLFRTYPHAERAKVIPTIMTVVVFAPAIGPVLGGLILEFLNWRWIFFVNLPVGAFGALFAWRVLREFEVETRRRLDVIGFILAGSGLALLVFTVSEGPSLGWGSATIISTGVGGIAALTAMVIWLQRTPNPLINLDAYRDRIFRASNIVSLFLQMGFMAVIFVMPLYLQSLRGESALVTGLTMAPQPLGVLIVSALAGRGLYRRVGPRRLILVGLTIAAIVGFFISRLDLESSLWTVRGLMFVRGIGFGFAFIAVQTAVYAGISMADTANATTLFTMQRQTAPAFGVAIAATLLAAFTGSQVVDGQLDSVVALQEMSAYQDALLLLVLPLIAALACGFLVHDSDAASTLADPA